MKVCMAVGIHNMCEMHWSKASVMYSSESKSIALGNVPVTLRGSGTVVRFSVVAVVALRLMFGKRLAGRCVSLVSSIASCRW